MLAGPAPQLRRLLLGGRLVNTPPSPDDELDDDYTFCPAMLYEGNTPRLEYLELYFLFHGIRFRGPLPSSLKHLQVRVPNKIRVHNAREVPPWPSAVDLLGVLSMLSSLKTLDIKQQQDDYLCPSSEGDPRHVHLPHLHTIRLSWSTSQGTMLLKYINAPSLMFLDITTPSRHYWINELVDVLQHTFGDKRSVQTLKIGGFGLVNHHLPLRIQGDAASDLSDRPQGHLKFNITLLDHIGEGALWLICQHVLDLLTLPAFALDMQDILYESSLAMLETMYQVTTFTLTGPYVMYHVDSMISPKSASFIPKYEGYVPFLYQNPADDSDDDSEDYIDRWPSPFLLPALETLVLQRALLYDDRAYGIPLMHSVDELCDVLRERASGGAAIKELCLRDCPNADAAVLSALKDVMEETGGRLTVM
ncbi:hypothetical protein FOMPIDRAFT_1060785 [Fomitopsis schrenkii]|uniref:Uncharacterized protein n=1 Tax=Fomitopsis schrenkii TaxID=2126942 RepID=S8FM02_FOMSC|nr:hypothetical protein FOMPIDRAFT_1060785 [Fomitopsis schrenkii]